MRNSSFSHFLRNGSHLRATHRAGGGARVVAGQAVWSARRHHHLPAVCRRLQRVGRVCGGYRAGPDHGAGVECAALEPARVAGLAHLVMCLCCADPLGSLRPLFGRLLALVSGGGHLAAGGICPRQAGALADPALAAARSAAAAAGVVRGDSAPCHGDQPVGGAALLYRYHSAGPDRCAACAALHLARLWSVLAGGFGARVGADDPELASRSAATVVATARLVAAALHPAVAALVRRTVAPGTLAVATGSVCAVVGALANTCPLATAGAGCGAGAGGADQQGGACHPL